MAYHHNRIKDEEIPALLFLLTLILDKSLGKEYWHLKDKDFNYLIEEADVVDSRINPISITVVKSIFKLIEKDTKYRPEYTSIDFLIYGFYKKKISFQSFIKNNRKEIQEEFAALNYKIHAKNFIETANDHISNIKQYTLSQKPIQINEIDGYVKKFFNTITQVVGDLSEKVIQEKITASKKSIANLRISKRLELKNKRHQQNIESIILKAAKFTHTKESNDIEPDADWIFNFFEKAQNTSNENMQYIWAKILANEVDKPGSFSRRAVNAVELIDHDEAKTFTLFCNCLWEIYPGETRSDKVLIKNINNDGYYSDATWGFDGMLIRLLEDLGLVHETFITFEKDEIYTLAFFGQHHEISSVENDIEVEMIRLSTIGAEIYEVVSIEKNIAYYESTLAHLNDIGLIIE